MDTENHVESGFPVQMANIWLLGLTVEEFTRQRPTFYDMTYVRKICLAGHTLLTWLSIFLIWRWKISCHGALVCKYKWRSSHYWWYLLTKFCSRYGKLERNVTEIPLLVRVVPSRLRTCADISPDVTSSINGEFGVRIQSMRDGSSILEWLSMEL